MVLDLPQSWMGKNSKGTLSHTIRYQMILILNLTPCHPPVHLVFLYHTCWDCHHTRTQDCKVLPQHMDMIWHHFPFTQRHEAVLTMFGGQCGLVMYLGFKLPSSKTQPNSKIEGIVASPSNALFHVYSW